jgi:uncharacterized protein YggE
MDRQIVVRGEAVRQAPPDRAVLRVRVEAEGAGRANAYAAAAAIGRALEEVLVRRAADLHRYAHAALTVSPKSRWRKGEMVRTGWFAVRVTTVDLTDFEVIGDLIAELVAAGGDVLGVAWELDEANPVHDEVRRLAARDARSRARAYAEALDVGLGDLRWVAEPGLRQAGEPVHAFAMAAGGARRDEEDTLDVTPPEMTLSAAVEVGYAIADPAAPD